MNRIPASFFLLLLGALLAWFLRRAASPTLFLEPRHVSMPPSPSPEPARPIQPRRRALSLSRPSPPPSGETPPRREPGRSYLSGRILDPQGRPQANRAFRFTLVRGRPGSRARLLAGKTDEEGFFLVPFRPPSPPGDTVTLEIRPMGPNGRPRRETLIRKSLQAKYPPGVHFLGDLLLENLPLLASGRVLDLSGRPLPGVEVQVWVQRLPLAGTPFRKKKRPGKVWAPLPFSCRSSREGRFEIRGETAQDLLQLRASAKGHFQKSAPLVPTGSRGVLLFLLPAGWVEGKILPPPGRSPQSFVVQVFPSAWEGEKPRFHQALPDRKGNFLVAGLPPGPARLEAGSLLDGHKLLELKGLEIRAGEPCSDPRLRALDLSGGKDSLLLTVTDPRGRPLRQVLALARPGPLRIYRGPGRNFLLPPAVRGKTLFLWAPGFLVKRLDPLPPGRKRKAKARVTLGQGILFQVRLDPSLPPPPGHSMLQVRLSLRFSRTASALEKAAAFFLGRSGLPQRPVPGRPGALEFHLPCPGVYSLAWGIRTAPGPAARTFWASAGKGACSVRVFPGARASSLTLHPEGAAYLALLKRAEASYARGHDEK